MLNGWRHIKQLQACKSLTRKVRPLKWCSIAASALITSFFASACRAVAVEVHLHKWSLWPDKRAVTLPTKGMKQVQLMITLFSRCASGAVWGCSQTLKARSRPLAISNHASI